MENERERIAQSWVKFLNPETLRGNLIIASIFLASYEMLQASVIDRIRDFFTFGYDEAGWIVSDEYKNEVLSLDKSPLRASLLWLKGMSVIDDADMTRVDEIRTHRNELAHELQRFLGDADAEINLDLLDAIYGLISKIDRWWILEVELAIDPDCDGREIDEEGILSGSMLSMQLMLRIAMGDDLQELWKEFQKLHRSEIVEAERNEERLPLPDETSHQDYQGGSERDSEFVARVKSLRGKYAHTANEPGTDELHRERQRDKEKEEAMVTRIKP